MRKQLGGTTPDGLGTPMFAALDQWSAQTRATSARDMADIPAVMNHIERLMAQNAAQGAGGMIFEAPEEYYSNVEV